MRCTACGAELLPGKTFCHTCGTRAALQCPGCGASVTPAFRFCPDCGRALAADGVHDGPPPPVSDARARLARHMPAGLIERVRSARTTIEGERKQLTVLFCDLAGSTAIAAELDPEDYHDLLDRYLDVVLPEIYGLDGIVNQLAGDGLMALFGAPVAHEDAPQRAVRAALGIQEALGRFSERLQAERGLELRARIGINTGPVVVGAVGNDLKMDYSAIGDTTNLAARLESLAAPGSILISEPTERLVRGFFALRAAGPFEVKGKREPVTAFEVLGRSEAATPMAVAVARGLTPLVGREAELAELTTAYGRVASGIALVVAVVGEAGLGKSRLVYEFRQRLAAEGTVFFEGRCSSMSRALPYHPFLGMFRRYFELGSGEDPAVVRAKLSHKAGVCWDRLEQTYPLLCRFLCVSPGERVDLPSDDLKHETFDALARLVLMESQRAPVVLLVEDLHWIDDPSHELLESLVARLAGARVLFVTSERLDGRPAWRSRAPFTQLVLHRLTDDEITAIIRAIVGAPLPRELEALLIAKAEGSPFFAEELTRSLIEEGHLVRNNGSHHLTRPVEEIRIPGSVREVLAARVDRLEPHVKRVLQLAAVLGRQFDRRQLGALLADDHVDVDAALATLESAGLLHRKTALSADEYRFGESLTQEVAYESLLLRQRRQLHERVARLLEAADGPSSAERSALVAHHYTRSDDRRRALGALLQAARDAEEIPSYRTAGEFYRQAWELAEAMALAEGGDDDSRRTALQAALGFGRLTVLFGLPYVAEAEQAITRVQGLAEALGDQEAVAGIHYFRGVMLMGRDHNQFARGLALAEEGLAIAQRAGLGQTARRIARGLALNYALDGRLDLARRAIGWVLDDLAEIGDARRVSDLYVSARWVDAMVRFLGDDLDEATARALETHALAVGVPNRTGTGLAGNLLAQLHVLRGDYAAARRWADESLAIAETISNVAGFPVPAAIALLSRLELGERSDTEHYLELIDQGLRAGGNAQWNIRFVIEALLAAGDLARAEHYAGELRRHAAGGRLSDAIVDIAVGEVCTRLGHLDEAERTLARAITMAEALGTRTPLAAAYVAAAELAAARGDARARDEHVARARAIARPLGLGRYLARAERLGTGEVPAVGGTA